MSNTEVLSAVHGIAPRSDDLLRLGTDLERGRVSQAAFDERLAQEASSWLDLQEAAGINIQENGKLRWQDHLRPIVKASSGFEEGIDEAPVTRWFETNTFYRQPTISGFLEFRGDSFVELVGQPSESVSLLAPGSFAKLCENRFDELPPDRNAIQLYGQIFSFLETSGVKRVVLEDYHSKEEIVWRNSSLADAEFLADGHANLKVSLIAPARPATAIPISPQPNLAVEVRNGSLEHFKSQPAFARPVIAGSEIWQQPVDVANTQIDVLATDDWPLQAIRLLKPTRLVLTHTVDCERLPLPYAQDKVKRLGEFASELQAKIEEEV